MRFSLLIVGAAIFMRFRLSLHGKQILYQWSELENHLIHAPFGLARVLSTAYTHALYLTKLCWPQYLCYDYGFDEIPLITAFSDVRNLHTVGAYAVTLWCLRKAWRDPRSPFLSVVSLALFSFVPAANIVFPAGAVLAERLLYLPSVGFCLAIGCLVEEAQGNLARKYPKYPSRPRTVLFGGLILIFFVKCILRNREWQTEERLFDSAARVAPNSVKVLNNLAKIYLTSEHADTAINLLQRALHIYSPHAIAHLNMALAYGIKNKYNHAMQSLSNSMQLEHEYHAAHGYYGDMILTLFGDVHTPKAKQYVNTAARHLDFAVSAPRPHPTFLITRGIAAAASTDSVDAALMYFDLAEQQNALVAHENIDTDRIVDMSHAYNSLANTLVKQNRTELAKTIYQHGLQRFPSSIELLNNAAVLYSHEGNYHTALSIYAQALALDPDNAVIATNAGEYHAFDKCMIYRASN